MLADLQNRYIMYTFVHWKCSHRFAFHTIRIFIDYIDSYQNLSIKNWLLLSLVTNFNKTSMDSVLTEIVGLNVRCLKVAMMKFSKKSLTSTLLIFFLINFSSQAQVTIFSENIGTPTGNTAIAAYSTGTTPATFQNRPSLTFSGNSDVRISTPSSGYTGASGNGNVFITSTSGTNFQISGINTSSYSSLLSSSAFSVISSTTKPSFK